MNQSLSLEYREKPPYRFYFFLVLLLYASMHFYVFPDALDITRYYDSVKDDVLHYHNILDYIESQISIHIDCIYSSSLYLANRAGIPLNLVTTLYLSIYYIVICELLRRNYGLKRIRGIILFYILMSAPFIWVQEISRNLAAIAFMYCSFFQFNKNNKTIAVLFVIGAVFTHFSLVIFVLLYMIAFFMQQVNLNRKIVILFFLAILIIGYISPSYLVNLTVVVAENSDNHYAAYASIENALPLFTTSIGYGDKIPMVYVYLFSLYLVLKNKKHDFYYWGLFVLTAGLSFALSTSLMLTNRIIMQMPLFIGWSICAILQQEGRKEYIRLYILSAIGTVCVLAHFWSYRLIFSI